MKLKILLALILVFFLLFLQKFITVNKRQLNRTNFLPTNNTKQHVFLIIMENTDWSNIKDNIGSAPFINSLLKRSDVSYADQYYNPSKLHPSESNYVWLEAGDSKNLPNGNKTIDFTTDNDPSFENSTSTKDHLVTYLNNNGISWKVYAEGIDGLSCPLRSIGETKYVAKHISALFFQDVTDNNSPTSVYCTQHIRPYSELATDIKNKTIGQYNVIIPDTCHNMHDAVGCETKDHVKNGDTWLADNLPDILNSYIYKSSGTIFLTWDEGANKRDGPIGMIVLSILSKGNSYHNEIHYDHSSLLRTISDRFHVSTYPRNASYAESLQDLFK